MRNPKRIAAVRYEEKVAMDTSREHWLNPIAMSQLKTAVNKNAKQVVLNGKVFDMSYGHMFGDTECVKLTPADSSWVPMGYVSIDKIKRSEFDQED